MVYFVQGEVTRLIKIGYTQSDSEQRFKALQTGSPDILLCLATIDGKQSKELQLHMQFKDSWHHGEWFEPTLELLDFIAKLPKGKHTGWQQSFSAPEWVDAERLEVIDSENRVWI